LTNFESGSMQTYRPLIDVGQRTDIFLREPRRRCPETKLVLDWGEDLQTGIDAIDADHKDLISYFNALVDASSDDSAENCFREIFTNMVNRTRSHFRREERIMRDLQYPDFHSHREAHENLIINARDFAFNIEHIYRAKDFILVVYYLRYWLINHIRKEDRSLRDFINVSRTG
jgi:hemerythrin